MSDPAYKPPPTHTHTHTHTLLTNAKVAKQGAYMWDTMVHIWHAQRPLMSLILCFVIPDAFLLGFGSEGFCRKHLII